jgi:hypothetical protein
MDVLKYNKHGVTNDVFNHIQCVYGEITFGSHVMTRCWMEYEDCNEDEARILVVCK